MLMNGELKARYISDQHYTGFVKGEVYIVTRPICDDPERWIAYTDASGNHYALPSYLFELVDE